MGVREGGRVRGKVGGRDHSQGKGCRGTVHRSLVAVEPDPAATASLQKYPP